MLKSSFRLEITNQPQYDAILGQNSPEKASRLPTVDDTAGGLGRPLMLHIKHQTTMMLGSKIYRKKMLTTGRSQSCPESHVRTGTIFTYSSVY